MMQKTGGEILVELLLHYGVDTIFVMPGEQLDPLFKALSKRLSEIRVVHVRHEQAAAYMAYGYARSTGRVGVCVVPPGPGVLNACAGLATAYAGNTSVLCITGQIPSRDIGKGYGLLHELPNQLGVLELINKWAVRIETLAQAQELVSRAFCNLTEGRPRPVTIEIAPDVLSNSSAFELVPQNIKSSRLELNSELIRKAAMLLCKAKKPLIMVGGGAYHASESLKILAEKLQIPVIANCSGKGVLSEKHYLSHSWPAGHRLWKETDVVLAVGTRLYQPRKLWGIDENMQIIHIDVDADELARHGGDALKILGDSQESILAIVDALDITHEVNSREKEMKALKCEFKKFFSTLKPQIDYVNLIRETLGDDGFFIDELTQVGYVSRFAFPGFKPRTYIPPTYQGTLGFGFASALGVKAAHPEKNVISISGDGGFLYTATELVTSVQCKLPVVAIVFNDNAYGNVKRSQKKDGYSLGTELHNPDFVALAKSFGAIGVRVNSLAELKTEIENGLHQELPTVIEVPIGEVPSPWAFIRLPKVRGI